MLCCFSTSLLVGLQYLLKSLQYVQTCAANSPTPNNVPTSFANYIGCLSLLCIHFKMLLLTFKCLNGLLLHLWVSSSQDFDFLFVVAVHFVSWHQNSESHSHRVYTASPKILNKNLSQYCFSDSECFCVFLSLIMCSYSCLSVASVS